MSGPYTVRKWRLSLRGYRPFTRDVWRGADVGLIYAGLVTGLALAPATLADQFVLRSSTNLANLRLHPLYVLVVSAFVESSLPQLLLIPVLVGAYTAVQRWLGRTAAIVTGIFGHVGATLGVATLLTAGIAHGRIALSVAHEADVGISYGLVAVLGLLTARVVPPWRAAYAGSLSAVLVAMLLVDRRFTDFGHMLAWLIGLGIALVVNRATTRATRTRTPSRTPQSEDNADPRAIT